MLNKLKHAIEDFRYLLNRGYNKNSSLKLVSDRYNLSKDERNFLIRAIFPKEEAERRKRKLVNINEIKGKKVVIDGYNVLITVENVLKGKNVFSCDDGLLRDTSATFGKYKITKLSIKAINEILTLLKEHNAKEIIFYFDSQVSFSGELCKIVMQEMEKLGIKGYAKTFKNVDYMLIQVKNAIVCTSDSVIIDKVDKVLDIPKWFKSLRMDKKGDALVA
ncbi:MAG: DUF434 domain-containing protein [Candidatus Hydrothermarchaeota archaeon]|nr:MAG: DUF434 domain-containing protein [Candidatus Hydrothermarchaeota archaeon]